jgi:hypothetical protein
MGANAQTAVPAFIAGEVLTAAEMTQVNTGIPVFATTTTRDAAFGGAGEKVLAEGQFAYIEAGDLTQYYNGTSWVAFSQKFNQIVSTTKTDTFTTTSGSFVDITGLSVTITPTSATSKVFVIVNMSVSCNTAVTGQASRLMRDGTAIAIGDAAGSRVQASSSSAPSKSGTMDMESVSFFDSPNTTSATVYKMQTLSQNPGDTVCVNRTLSDINSGAGTRTVSTITVIEVLA